MPKCDCSGSNCQCLILAGSGIEVTGSGNTANPYVITSTNTLSQSLLVQDTDTVNLEAVGAGTPEDPYVLSATATLTVEQLLDVEDAIPQTGDTLSWDGTQWVFGPPPVAPEGAINVGPGLTGDGSVGAPVRASTSGTWGLPPLAGLGTDSTIGQAIYVDANNQLRAAPLNPDTLQVSWDNVIGKPSNFPTTWDDVKGKPTSFPTSWSNVSGRPVIARGSLSVECKADQTIEVPVTFAAGLFPLAPNVQETVHSTIPRQVTWSHTGVTTRGFTIHIYSTNTATRTVSWLAVLEPGHTL